MKNNILLRSFMFLPAYNCKFIEKALVSDADAIILDMEDSVPEDKRQIARENIIRYSKENKLNNKNVFIRINHIGTKDFVEDMSQLVVPGINGFMPSKIYTVEDIVFIDKLLSFFELKNGLKDQEILLAPLIETVDAVNNAKEIAKSSDRLVALCLGGEDYLNDLGSVYTYQESALEYPRALLVNAARAAGILPIDTPYVNIPDLEGFKKREKLAYQNGFAGCLVLNPKQIDIANYAFMPDNEKVNYSYRVIEAVKQAMEENSSGVAMLDGGMVGPPMRKRAEAVLKQMEIIENQNK